MRIISNLNSRESTGKSNLKKGYVIVFLGFIILIIVGGIILSITRLIPSVDWGDPGYDEYITLTTNLATVSVLFQNIGITLFSLSTFLGAITDERLSKEVRRGMVIASGIGVIALLVLGASFQIIYIP